MSSANIYLEFKDLGIIPYQQGIDFQEEELKRIIQGVKHGSILVMEHFPVITLGKNADGKNLLVPQENLSSAGVDLLRSERGGEITAHMPGQLVVYPVLYLPSFNLTVRKYVTLLEDAVIGLLDQYGIRGGKDDDAPGVWVGGAKICSIGVRIKQRVTTHGIALNIANDLGLFQKIVPCGLPGKSMCSLGSLGVEGISVKKAGLDFARFLAQMVGKELFLGSWEKSKEPSLRSSLACS